MVAMTPSDLDVRHAFADVNDLRMHYVEAGPAAAPDAVPVLLLHGFPEMWWSWRYQIPTLAAAGYRVIAPDLRGYNETQAKGPYDIDTLRDDVVALLDHLKIDKAVVVSHDWGGAVAWHLAGTRQARCAKLVAMNCPHPLVFQRAIRRWSQTRRSWYIFFFQIPWLPETLLAARGGEAVARILRSAAVDKTHFGTGEIRPFMEAVQKPGRARAMVEWYRAAFQGGLQAMRGGGAVAPAPPAITIPTLILWGMNDVALNFDDIVPGTRRYAPGVEIHTIPDCGHFVQQEQPEEVNRLLLEWIKR
jgi:pimeloyl-ACP methyl ester carboxylesterase